MTNISGGWRAPIRGAAAFLGAVGLILMSTGLSLFVQGSAAASSTTVHKSYVCKYVGKPGQGERLQTGQNPIWVDNDSLPGAVRGALAYVGETFGDAQGKSVVIVANTPRLSPEPSVADCPGVVTPSVQFTDSACVDGSPSTPSWTGTDTADITYTITDGSVANGTSVTITATPNTNFAFAADADNVFTHTFGSAASNCGGVQPPPPPTPTVVTPDVSFIDSACAGGVATSPSWTGSDTADIAYAVTAGTVADGSSVTITATPMTGFAFAPSATSTFSHTFGPAASNCGAVQPPAPPAPTVVTPGVSFVDSTCSGVVATSPSWTGSDTADIAYAVTAGTVADGSSVTITATPKTGFTFTPSSTSTFSHTFGPEANCGVAGSTVVTPRVSFVDSTCSGVVATSPSWSGSDTGDVAYAVTAGAVADGSSVTITATPKTGFAFAPSASSTFSHTFGPAAAHCAGVHATAVTSVAARFENPECPTDAVAVDLGDAGFLSPAQWKAKGDALDTRDIRYTITGSFAPGGTVRVAAAADRGFVLTTGSVSHWLHTFTGKLTCSKGAPVVIPTAIDAGLATLGRTTTAANSARYWWICGVAGTGTALFIGALALGRRQGTRW